MVYFLFLYAGISNRILWQVIFFAIESTILIICFYKLRIRQKYDLDFVDYYLPIIGPVWILINVATGVGILIFHYLISPTFSYIINLTFGAYLFNLLYFLAVTFLIFFLNYKISFYKIPAYCIFDEKLKLLIAILLTVSTMPVTSLLPPGTNSISMF
jgi:hypothetical protein